MSEPLKFRKKPVTIEAMHLSGNTAKLHDVYLWVESHVGSTKPACDFGWDEALPDQGITIDPVTGFFEIWTLEGRMQAKPGDWIIRGVQGEFYPCKPDIFEQTYGAAE